MKLAVIARALGPNLTGRGLVAAELIRAFTRVRPKAEVHVFAPSQLDWPGIVWHGAQASGELSRSWAMMGGTALQLRQLQPDIVWCSTHLLPVGLERSLRVISTLHDVVWRDQPDSMALRNRWAARWGEGDLRRANRIVCVSQFTRERLTHYWPQLAGRARTVRNSFGTAITRERPCLREASRPIVANVGTLEPRKNVTVLVSAMEAMPDVELHQCGGRGWKISQLVEQARRLPNVKLLGYSSDDVVHCLYRTAVVAAFPSTYEGFHMPPLDAMAIGCPVIASDIPAHREILGDAAVYVPPHDRSAWTSALRRVIDDQAERRRLAAAGRAQASRYSWNKSAEAMLSIMDEVLDG